MTQQFAMQIQNLTSMVSQMQQQQQHRQFYSNAPFHPDMHRDRERSVRRVSSNNDMECGSAGRTSSAQYGVVAQHGGEWVDGNAGRAHPNPLFQFTQADKKGSPCPSERFPPSPPSSTTVGSFLGKADFGSPDQYARASAKPDLVASIREGLDRHRDQHRHDSARDVISDEERGMGVQPSGDEGQADRLPLRQRVRSKQSVVPSPSPSSTDPWYGVIPNTKFQDLPSCEVSLSIVKGALTSPLSRALLNECFDGKYNETMDPAMWLSLILKVLKTDPTYGPQLSRYVKQQKVQPYQSLGRRLVQLCAILKAQSEGIVH